MLMAIENFNSFVMTMVEEGWLLREVVKRLNTSLIENRYNVCRFDPCQLRTYPRCSDITRSGVVTPKYRVIKRFYCINYHHDHITQDLKPITISHFLHTSSTHANMST